MSRRVDVVVVGAGIVGLATAYRLLQKDPATKVRVVEKEEGIAQHQTSHNSGVLHSGIYYKPGSLRALNCRDGRSAMVEFCAREGLPFEICGKVIVAVDRSEIPRLERIHQRGVANGVDCALIDSARLREIEPHVAGVAAIHVPDAGITDFAAVAERLALRIEELGGEIETGWELRGLEERPGKVILRSDDEEVEAGFAVACAGLYSDRVARLAGADPSAKIVPFRGEYYTLASGAQHLCRNLIYPVPDPSFPFLGVHLTRMIGGGVECGPNAVLALAREGYSWGKINGQDLAESLTYPGFLRLAGRNWRAGLSEVWRSLSKAAFVRALQRLVPEIQEEHLVAAPAGVRAQALDRHGNLVDDFLFVESERVIHVCNAPSPAATAALNIGGLIVDKLAARLQAAVT